MEYYEFFKKSHIELFYDFQQDVFSYKQEPEYILPRQKRFFNLNENQELINKTILNNNAFILNKINEIKDNEYNFNHIFIYFNYFIFSLVYIFYFSRFIL